VKETNRRFSACSRVGLASKKGAVDAEGGEQACLSLFLPAYAAIALPFRD